MLVIGGCGGASVVYSDVWLLDMGAEIPDAKATWVWTKLEVLGTQNAPAHLWCHPACKVIQLYLLCHRYNFLFIIMVNKLQNLTF